MYEQTIAEQLEKERAMVGELKGAGIAGTGAGNSCMDSPKRESLRDRLEMNRRRAQRESYKLSRLDELIYLLDKNPEVARILDLVEDLGR